LAAAGSTSYLQTPYAQVILSGEMGLVIFIQVYFTIMKIRALYQSLAVKDGKVATVLSGVNTTT
jgi:hypothetical protein